MAKLFELCQNGWDLAHLRGVTVFSGSMTAMVTPMHQNGDLDFVALGELITFQISNQTNALVIAGTTGESPTIENAEFEKLVDFCVRKVDERVPVIVGTGSHSTKITAEKTIKAMQLGADAVLIVTPYYNRPTQEGLYQHYAHIAEAVPIPLIVYNVPQRTGCDLLPETMLKLARFSNIIGIKEASGSMKRLKELCEMQANQTFDIYAGDDASALAYIQGGAKGVVSVTANIAPQQMATLCYQASQGNWEQAQEINSRLELLHESLFVETNPIPVKWALHQLGKIEEGIRLPLTWLDESFETKLRHALLHAKLLS